MSRIVNHNPKISIILPTAPDWRDLTYWTLRSYGEQTIKDFEVIIVEDGEPSQQITSLIEEVWPFAIRYFSSARLPDNLNLAHKNHARNVGWKNAYGEIMFFSDCDFMVEPHFIERALLLYKNAQGLGEPFCMYTPCGILGSMPETWPDAPVFPENLATKVDPFLKNFPAKREHEAEPKLLKIKAHPEGMHFIQRELVRKLGGFDEAFLGWGANKMEFQHRINDIASIKQYMMEGCSIWHQPHEHKGDNTKAPEIKRRNVELMRQLDEERKQDPAWPQRVKHISEQNIGMGGFIEDWIAGELPTHHFSTEAADWVIHKKIIHATHPAKTIVFIGPWIGEFGWEVARWQGGINKMLLQDEYRSSTIIACGDPGHYPLYGCDEYWSLPKGYYNELLTRETHRALPEDRAKKILACVKGLIARELSKRGVKTDLIEPTMQLTRSMINPDNQACMKIKPSQEALSARDYVLRRHGIDSWICIFPRQRKLNPIKDWPGENWKRLCELIHDEYGCGIIAIGRPEDTQSLNIKAPWFLSTVRANPDLDLNLAFISGAICCIGSESGGTFLSLHCGSPTYVMGATPETAIDPKAKQRYLKTENPLNTLCMYVEKENYQHTLDETVIEIEPFLNLCMEQGREEKPRQTVKSHLTLLPKDRPTTIHPGGTYIMEGNKTLTIPPTITKDGETKPLDPWDEEREETEEESDAFEYSQSWYETHYHKGEYNLDNRSWEDVQSEWDAKPHCMRFHDAIKEVEPPGLGARCLDIGCHHGKSMKWILDYFPEIGSCLGLDFSLTAVDWCTREFPDIRGSFRHWDLAKWQEYNLGYFDFITCLDFTEHIPHELMPELAKFIYSCLKPGGQMLLLGGVTRQPEHINIMTEDALSKSFPLLEHKMLSDGRHHLFTMPSRAQKVGATVKPQSEGAKPEMIVFDTYNPWRDYVEVALNKLAEFGGEIAQSRLEIEAICKIVAEEEADSYLEIGTKEGGTLLSLVPLLKSGATAYCVDPDFQESAMAAASYLSQQGYQIKMAKAPSEEAIEYFRQELAESLDIIVIDGCHLPGSCTRDFNDYWPLLKPNGLMLIHDISNQFCSCVGREWKEISFQNGIADTSEVIIASQMLCRREPPHEPVDSPGWGIIRKSAYQNSHGN